MKIKQCEEVLRTQYLPQNLDAITLKVAFEAFYNFYNNERAEKVSLNDDSDMLLFEYGIYSWEDGLFVANLTRQLCPQNSYKMYQLCLSVLYEPTDELEALPEIESTWCASPHKLEEYKQYIHESQAFQLLSNKLAIRIKVRLTEL